MRHIKHETKTKRDWKEWQCVINMRFISSPLSAAEQSHRQSIIPPADSVSTHCISPNISTIERNNSLRRMYCHYRSTIKRSIEIVNWSHIGTAHWLNAFEIIWESIGVAWLSVYLKPSSHYKFRSIKITLRAQLGASIWSEKDKQPKQFHIHNLNLIK